MSRRIVKSDHAEADIAEVFAYLDEHSPDAAERLAVEIDARCALLALHPGIGRLREELVPQMRSSVIGSYLLFYRATEEAIEVFRFLHGSRDLETQFPRQ